MRSHPGVAAKVFETLGENGINIEMISTSPIKISCVIAADQVPDAVRALHAAFDLGDGGIQPEDPTGVHRPDGYVMSYRVGVLGATGAVGSTILERPRRAGLSGLRARAACLRALGRQARPLRGRRARGGRGLRRVDPGPRHRPQLGRRLRLAPSGRRRSSTRALWSSTTRATGGCTTTCRSSFPRSIPTRSRATRA